MRGGCDFEMTIPVTANIVECADDGSIPLKHYAFVPIANVENCAKDTVVGKTRIILFSPLNLAHSRFT